LSADRSQNLLDRILARDTLILGVSLTGITLLAWWYVYRLAAGMDMGGMDMTGFQMLSTGARMVMAPAAEPWSAGEFLLMFLMWAVMMIGMMAPSAAPVLLLYARVARQASRDGRPLTSTAWFAAGYLGAWTMFALAVTAAQWALQRAAVLSPAMATASSLAGGAVLVAAGIYQWSPLKDACLAHCQSPITFLQRHGGFRRGPAGTVELGLRHGLYCVGCCWMLMALLFAGGIMNLTWIAGLSILVLLEKATPAGRTIARLAGVVLVVGGLVLAT
jgi:predicted metal-binding membrane protein